MCCHPLLSGYAVDWDLYIFRQKSSNNVLAGAPAISLRVCGSLRRRSAVPFLVKDKEVEEPGFSRVNHVIQELESAQLNTVLKETPHLSKRVENYVLSLRVAKRLISNQTYQMSFRLRKDPGVNQSSVSREHLARLKRIFLSGYLSSIHL